MAMVSLAVNRGPAEREWAPAPAKVNEVMDAAARDFLVRDRYTPR
jgi:hypothetical protein